MRLMTGAWIFFTLLNAAADHSWDQSFSSNDGIQYRGRDGEYFERFIADTNEGVVWWQSGRIETKNGRGGRSRDAYTQVDMTELHNCSNDGFRCAYGAHQVFAIPRNGIAQELQFVTSGAVFRIEKCLRRDSDNARLP